MGRRLLVRCSSSPLNLGGQGGWGDAKEAMKVDCDERMMKIESMFGENLS